MPWGSEGLDFSALDRIDDTMFNPMLWSMLKGSEHFAADRCQSATARLSGWSLNITARKKQAEGFPIRGRILNKAPYRELVSTEGNLSRKRFRGLADSQRNPGRNVEDGGED